LIKHLRPDLKIVPLRGNVETRLRKLQAGDFDATVLAVAGLKRLGLLAAASSLLDPEAFVPAVGQGAIGIETRDDDARTRALVDAINDADTATALAAERAFLAVLDGSCRTPIGGYARVSGDTIRFRGLIAKTDGSEVLDISSEGRRQDAAKLGAGAGHDLKARAGSGFFAED
jgi:hydroxymethylbilane synthase